MSDWQPAPGWEGSYEVSRWGSIRKIGGTLVGQWANDQGYMLARLSSPRRVVRVHRLVAAAFIPNPLGLPFVNHKDNERAHNSDSNLEWCTQKGNLDHARRQGRMPDNHWVGRRSPNARLTDDDARAIKRRYSEGDVSWQHLASQYGVSKRAVGRIVSGETYSDVQ